jgi:O-antigen ligase/tetratricopeptide (TPR) repeat protein
MRIDTDRVRRHIETASFGLLVVLLFVSPLARGSLAQQHWSLMAVGALLCGALAFVARGLGRDPSFRFNPLTACLLGLVGLTLLQLVPLPAGLVGVLSPSRLQVARQTAEAIRADAPSWLALSSCMKCTRDSFLRLAAYVAVYYAASTMLAAPRRRKIAFGSIAIAGLVLAAYGLYRALVGADERLSSAFVSPNRFASFMGIAAACAAGIFIVERKRKRSLEVMGLRPPVGIEWIVAAGILSVALVLTLSRMGIAAVLVACVLTIAIHVRRRSVWAALTAVLVLLAINAVLAVDPVLSRYSVLFEHDRYGGGRLLCWRQAAGVVGDYPLFGSGAGSFKHVFRLYQQPSLPGWWTYAHNDYLNLLCDLGVLGLLVGGAAIAFGLIRINRLRSSPERSDKAVAFAAFFGATAVLIHSLADFPLQEPALALSFFVVVGCAAGRTALLRSRLEVADESDASPAGAPWTRQRMLLAAARAAGALVILAVLVPVLVRLRMAGSLREAADAVILDEGLDAPIERLETKREFLERVVALDEWDDDARYQIAQIVVGLMKDPVVQRDSLELVSGARQHIARGVSVSPLDPRPYYLLAVLTWRPTAQGMADEMMRLSLAMAPAWHDVSFQVGRYFLMRWVHHTRGGNSFGFSRWGRTVTDDPAKPADDLAQALFRQAASALTYASRSPQSRRMAAEYALSFGLSAQEIDRLLQPDANTQVVLADGLARRGDNVGAHERYAAALAADPLVAGQWRVLVRCAGSLLAAGRIDEGLAAFDRVLACAPGDDRDDAIRSLARLRPERGGASRMVAYWSNVLEHSPGTPAAYLALAEAQLAAGSPREGFENLLQYAKLASDPGAYRRLIHIALGSGEAALASVLAGSLLRIEPNAAANHLLHASVLTRLGKNDAAVSAYESAISLDPASAAAVRALARMHAERKRFDETVGVWHAFIDAGGDELLARTELAEVYLQLRDVQRAKQELGRALAIDAEDDRARELLRRVEEANETD